MMMITDDDYDDEKVQVKDLGTCYNAAYMSRLKNNSALQSQK